MGMYGYVWVEWNQQRYKCQKLCQLWCQSRKSTCNVVTNIKSIVYATLHYQTLGKVKWAIIGNKCRVVPSRWAINGLCNQILPNSRLDSISANLAAATEA